MYTVFCLFWSIIPASSKCLVEVNVIRVCKHDFLDCNSGWFENNRIFVNTFRVRLIYEVILCIRIFFFSNHRILLLSWKKYLGLFFIINGNLFNQSVMHGVRTIKGPLKPVGTLVMFEEFQGALNCSPKLPSSTSLFYI